LRSFVDDAKAMERIRSDRYFVESQSPYAYGRRSAMVTARNGVGMGKDVEVRVEGPGSADELRSLRTWLIDDDDFRGRVQLHEADPPRGR
jgi:hypothetical protein